MMTDLDLYLQQNKLRQFQFGAFDCCLFSYGWIRIKDAFQVDIPEYQGTVGAVRAARHLVDQLGFNNLNDFLSDKLTLGRCENGAIVAKKTRIADGIGYGYGIYKDGFCFFADHAGLVRIEAEENDMTWYSDALLPKPI